MMYATATARRNLRDGAMSGPSEILSEFWQQWLEHKDSLYRCCFKLMNWNQTEAEDALHDAMVKASEKVQEYTGKIANLKAWLYQLTKNHCIDIIRERSNNATGVESIEEVGDLEYLSTVTPTETPEQALEKEEEDTKIYGAIDSLPELQRSTYILHFYEDLKHPEIAEIQGISYNNVCKRISRARNMLDTKLSGYFLGSEGEASPKASARKLSLTPPFQGEKQFRHRCETSKEADECVQVVVEVKPVKGSREHQEIEKEKISEQAIESGIQPVDKVGPVTAPATTSAEKFTPIVSAIAKEQEIAKHPAPEMAQMQEILVIGSREHQVIEWEKISEQAIESGIHLVDKGGPVTAPATTSAEKETTIVSAIVKEQEVVKLWDPEMAHIQEILVPKTLTGNKSASARSTHRKWYLPILAAIKSAFREMSQRNQRNALHRTIAGSTVTSSVASEPIGESPPVVARSVQQEESAVVAARMGKLEVIRECLTLVMAAPGERQLAWDERSRTAPIWAVVQFVRLTVSRINSGLAVLCRQQQPSECNGRGNITAISPNSKLIMARQYSNPCNK